MRTKEQIREASRFMRRCSVAAQLAENYDPAIARAFSRISEALDWALGQENPFGEILAATMKQPETVQVCPACQGKCACCANGI